MNHFDARVRYTRMVIEESFLALLQEKPAARITVTELCQRAQINRATFYKHYLDIPDLLEKLEEQVLDLVRQIFLDSPISYDTFMLEFLRCFRRNSERFIALSSDHGNPNLIFRAFMICHENAYPLLLQALPELSEEKRGLLYQFLAHGCGGILADWASRGMRESPEEIHAFITDLCSRVVGSFQS